MDSEWKRATTGVGKDRASVGEKCSKEKNKEYKRNLANDRKKIRRVETEKRQTEKRSLGSGNRESAKREKGSAGNKNGIRTERQKKCGE